MRSENCLRPAHKFRIGSTCCEQPEKPPRLGRRVLWQLREPRVRAVLGLGERIEHNTDPRTMASARASTKTSTTSSMPVLRSKPYHLLDESQADRGVGSEPKRGARILWQALPWQDAPADLHRERYPCVQTSRAVGPSAGIGSQQRKAQKSNEKGVRERPPGR